MYCLLKYFDALITQRQMKPFTIVEFFDVLEDAVAGGCLCLIFLAMNQLFLERRKEAFHHGITLTVSFAAHATLKPVEFRSSLELLTAIPTPMIRVM